MIKYSAQAARALGYLKRKYNDIEIFVEDTASQAVWIRILSAILPKKVKIRSVNMLGGRESVIKACRLDQEDDGRKKLYVIDGDLDFIRGIKKKQLRHLYRLRAYCVENILISEEKLTEIALDCDGSLSWGDAKKAINYKLILSDNEKILKRLFSIYATARELNSSIKTVGYSVRNLLDSQRDRIILSREKVIRRCRDLIRALCKEHHVARVKATRMAMEAKAHHLPLQMTVSGKDYLLPLVQLHLSRCCGFKGTDAQLKTLLARDFEQAMEPYFARRVRQLIA